MSSFTGTASLTWSVDMTTKGILAMTAIMLYITRCLTDRHNTCIESKQVFMCFQHVVGKFRVTHQNWNMHHEMSIQQSVHHVHSTKQHGSFERSTAYHRQGFQCPKPSCPGMSQSPGVTVCDGRVGPSHCAACCDRCPAFVPAYQTNVGSSWYDTRLYVRVSVTVMRKGVLRYSNAVRQMPCWGRKEESRLVGVGYGRP